MSDHVSARFVSIATATGDAGASLEMVMPMETPTLFISYSHQDEAWKDRLQKQLAFLKIRLISWDDRNISGGADWQSEIHEAMNQANLAILLGHIQLRIRCHGYFSALKMLDRPPNSDTA